MVRLEYMRATYSLHQQGAFIGVSVLDPKFTAEAYPTPQWVPRKSPTVPNKAIAW